MDEHKLSLEEVCSKLETDLNNGLTDQQAADRNI